MKTFAIITIFPEILNSYFNESILGRAQKSKLIKIKTHNLRNYTLDKHRKIDDKPYGGGAGMVMMFEPIYRALKKLKALKSSSKKTRTILLAANGKKFKQADAKRLSKYDKLVFVCGRYEGIDARVEKFVDEKISIGPYVVTGGELPAAMIIDAVSRMVKGVVGKEESVINESYANDSLEHPHYTRPDVIKLGNKRLSVPKVLLGGNHKNIADWRLKQSKKA